MGITLADFQNWLKQQSKIAVMGTDLQSKLLDASQVLDWLTPATSTPPQPIALMQVMENVRIRQTPSLAAAVLGSLAAGATVKVRELTNGFYKLADQEGYSAAAYLSPVAEPAPAPPIVVIPPKTVLGSIGAHILDKYESSLSRYPVFKVVDNLPVMRQAHEANPSSLKIYRRYYPVDVQGSYIAQSGGPGPAAQRWLDTNLAEIAQLPFAYHEGFNEVDPTPEMIEFEYQRVTLLASRNLKACVLNLAVGHTSDELWRRPDVLRLLKLVEQYNGIVGLHCYAEGIMSSNCGPYFWKADGSWSVPNVDPLPGAIDPAQCWLALRIIRDMQIVRSLGVHVQFVATELGIDDCVMDGNGIFMPHGVRTRGWKSCIKIWEQEGWLRGTNANAFYLRQLNWWAEQAGIPGCVYAHGDTTQWNDITGVFDTVGLL